MRIFAEPTDVLIGISSSASEYSRVISLRIFASSGSKFTDASTETVSGAIDPAKIIGSVTSLLKKDESDCASGRKAPKKAEGVIDAFLCKATNESSLITL